MALNRNVLRGAAVALVAVGAVAIYLTVDTASNQAVAACAASTHDAASRLGPLANGEMAAFRLLSQPVDVTDLAFQDGDGNPITMANFAGKTVLLNIWATWCVPCRAEMPSLDALAASTAGQNFEVVPVSVDTVDVPDRPRAFFADEIHPAALQLFLDPAFAIIPQMKEIGMLGGVPTSMIVDPDGCVIGVLEGPADWASPEAHALVEAAQEVRGAAPHRQALNRRCDP